MKTLRRFILTIALFAFSIFFFGQTPIEHVNMFIGSTGEHKTEYGGTTPAVSEPFGMTQWCAATRVNGISRTMYHYDDNEFIGFQGTHQPAVWMGDYGFLTFMPQVDNLKIKAKERAVALSHSHEIATPYYYRLAYQDAGAEISTEFTATSRCSFFRIKYPEGKKPILYIEASRAKDGGEIEVDPAKQEIRIYNFERHDSHLGPRLYNFKACYVLKFSTPFISYGTWNNDVVNPEQLAERGANVGGYIEFEPSDNVVEVRIGTSFISHEQAMLNLEQEIADTETFEGLTAKVKTVWENNLNKIAIKGASKDDLDIFYTAYFRTMQYPREFSEYGKYYSAFDDKVHNGVSYNAYSLWDTFRAQHPWLQLTQPQRVNDMVQALVQMYQEGGWIPKWPNPTYTNIMIGTHADAVIADAYVNGFRGYDLETAYQAIRKNAFTAPRPDYRWGDRHYWNGSYEARGGLKEYIDLGYVTADKTNESVSRTLEFAMDDYCIAQMAKGLRKTEDYEVLMQRAQHYHNIFNPETQFFNAKRSDGSWGTPNEGFTEGGKWTYRFCVMQDVKGLIDLHGGNEKFVTELDKNFDEGYYRHDNEPGHHFVYLYNHANRLDKAQLRIPQIIEENYKNKPGGLSGNDDCGQMSAWYLFSSMGFYPLTPASGEYALGIPRFEEISLQLANNKKLIVKAKDIKKKKTLPNVFFNGKKLDTAFIAIQEVMNGGVLEFR